MPPVVFLHGFMGNAVDWAEVIQQLGDTFYCMVIDLPGHGKSLGRPVPQGYTMEGAVLGIVQAMEKAGIVPAALVGYSMGGRLALYLAVRHGHVCSRLVVESATAGIVEAKEREKRRLLDEAWAGHLHRGSFEDFLRTWYVQPVFETLAQTPELFERIVKQRLANDPLELARALEGMGVGSQAHLWDRLSELAMPVLLLAGERDRKYVGILQAMEAQLPGAVLEIVPQVGHNIHAENPRGVAERLKDFLLKE